MTRPEPVVRDAGDVIGEQQDIVRRAKEFLYVDVERVRSYYAQLNRGVIDSVVNTATSSTALDGEAKLVGIGLAGGRTREASRQESRSLHDLTYVVFKELLQREGLLTALGPDWSEPYGWATGRLHEQLVEGQVLRFTGDVQILDPTFVRSRITQVTRVARAIAGLTMGAVEPEAAPPPSRQGGRTHAGKRPQSVDQVRDAQKEAAVQAILGDVAPAMFNEIADFTAGFTNDSIVVRAQPCGPGRPELHFGGMLLSRSDYVQEDREALFSRYGTQLRDWTVVMQVARLPASGPSAEVDLDEIDIVDATGKIDRAGVERMVSSFLTVVEGTGLAEGSVFPAIPVTVLAIYREFA